MCNECKKEIKHLKDLIGVDGEDFLESHGFSTVLQALSYLLTKVDQPNAKIGSVRPRDGHFEPVDAVSRIELPKQTFTRAEVQSIMSHFSGVPCFDPESDPLPNPREAA